MDLSLVANATALRVVLLALRATPTPAILLPVWGEAR
jgi:hypothetical protein